MIMKRIKEFIGGFEFDANSTLDKGDSVLFVFPTVMIGLYEGGWSFCMSWIFWGFVMEYNNMNNADS